MLYAAVDFPYVLDSVNQHLWDSHWVVKTVCVLKLNHEAKKHGMDNHYSQHISYTRVQHSTFSYIAMVSQHMYS